MHRIWFIYLFMLIWDGRKLTKLLVLSLFKWYGWSNSEIISSIEEMNKYDEVVGTQGLTVEERTCKWKFGEHRKNPMVINWIWKSWYNFVTSKMFQYVCVTPVYACIYVCTYIRAYVHTYAHICARVHTYAHICMHMYTCICFLFAERV